MGLECCSTRNPNTVALPFQKAPCHLGQRILDDVSDAFFNAVIQAVKDAEAAKEEPVYVLEVYKAFRTRSRDKTDIRAVHNVLFDLYRND